jgi:hypothetical protein
VALNPLHRKTKQNGENGGSKSPKGGKQKQKNT